MRMAICMTDTEERRRVATAIGEELRKQGRSFLISEYAAWRDLCYETEDGTVFDAVVFLPQAGDGEWIGRLRAAGFCGKLILVYPDDAFAVQGYAWGVDAYWLLPIDADAVSQLADLVDAFHERCLTVVSRRSVIHVPFSQIVCAESRNAKCILHREDGEELVVYCRLDAIAAQLRDKRFLRCHQSYLINMDHVVAVEKQFVLTGGKTAAIRQRDLKEIREHYRAYEQRRRSVHAPRVSSVSGVK